MNNTIWNKRIPTLFGLVVILSAIVLTSFLAKNGVIFQGRASPSEEPHDIRITNVSSDSFTISYTTDDSVPGSLSFGQTLGLGNTIFDDRDKQNAHLSSYHVHYLTVAALKPTTKYYFSVLSGSTNYLNNGKPFEVSTASQIPNVTASSQKAQGKLMLPNGNAPGEAIVYIKTAGSQTLSALISSDGTYSISLDALRNDGLTSFFTYPQNSVFQLLFVRHDAGSHVSALASQLQSLPIVILSKDYDFTNTSQIPSSFSQSQFPSFSVFVQNQTPPVILIPRKNQGFIDLQPQLSGIALANSLVSITIQPDFIITSVTADTNGNWKFRPTKPLSVGQHTLVIQAKDASGILQTLSQPFTIFALGSQVTESATPSATPRVTLAPTLSPTPTLTPSPTPTLSITPSASATPTLAPSPTPIPTATPVPTFTPIPTLIVQKPTLAPAGNSSAITVGVAALTTTIIGILLLLIL